MRDKYYHLLQEHNILDVFQEVEILSYSKKIQLLTDLLIDFSPTAINMALYEYKFNYIDIERVDLRIIDKVLKGLCLRYAVKFKKEKEEDFEEEE